MFSITASFRRVHLLFGVCCDETWRWRVSLVVGLSSVLTPLLSLGHDSFVDLERQLSQLDLYLFDARPGNGCKERRGYGRGCGLSSNGQPIDPAENEASNQSATMELPELSPALLEAVLPSSTREDVWMGPLGRSSSHWLFPSRRRKMRGVSFLPIVSPFCTPSRGSVASADQYLGLERHLYKRSAF